LSFEDESYDIVIDKGTYDALACADDKSMSNLLMKEMIWVCKKAGNVFEISSGNSDVIIERFKSIIPDT